MMEEMPPCMKRSRGLHREENVNLRSPSSEITALLLARWYPAAEISAVIRKEGSQRFQLK